MRAAIWDGPGTMSVGTVPDARCPEDGVLLRVTACGICGTDVRTFYNGDRRIAPPWVLGHEISGEVIEIGPQAAGRDRRDAASRSATSCTASRRSGAAAAGCAAAATSTCARNGG